MAKNGKIFLLKPMPRYNKYSWSGVRGSGSCPALMSSLYYGDKPNDKVDEIRPGRHSGPGPFFKSRQKPILEVSNSEYIPFGEGVDYWLTTSDKNCQFIKVDGLSAEYAHYSGSRYRDGITSIDYSFFSMNDDGTGGVRYWFQYSGSPGGWGLEKTPTTLAEAKAICFKVAQYAGIDIMSRIPISKWVVFPDGSTHQVWTQYPTFTASTDKYNRGYTWIFLGEQEILKHIVNFWSLVDIGVIDGSIKNLVAQAYTNAAGALPDVMANSVANVCDAAEAVAKTASTAVNIYRAAKGNPQALKRQLLGEAKDFVDPRNQWLTWRYVYNTTKMDIDDYKTVTARLIELDAKSKEMFKVNGTSSQDGVHCHCVLQVRTDYFDPTAEGRQTADLLRQYGFDLNARNAWDMIPFSFVADWFLQIGSRLENLELYNKARRVPQVGLPWFSITVNQEGYSVFYRWQQSAPPSPPVYINKTVGDRTIQFRIADSISLFT